MTRYGGNILCRLLSTARPPPEDRETLWGGRRGMATSSLSLIDGVPAMPQPNDLSRSLVTLDQNSTIIAVIEMSQSSWLVAGMLPGIERQPRKKLEPNPERLLGLLHRWRDETVRAGRTITRIAVAFEGRPRRLLAGALACGAWHRGACDPCLECRGIAGTSPSQNRPARHRVAEARVLGMAAWRTGSLHHGARANDCRRGRQAAEPRARLPGGGTHADCEPDKVHLGPAGHSQLQTNPAQGGRASGSRAHPGGRAAAAKHLGRAAARHGPAGLCCQPDPGDRESSSETIRAAS